MSLAQILLKQFYSFESQIFKIAYPLSYLLTHFYPFFCSFCWSFLTDRNTDRERCQHTNHTLSHPCLHRWFFPWICYCFSISCTSFAPTKGLHLAEESFAWASTSWRLQLYSSRTPQYSYLYLTTCQLRNPNPFERTYHILILPFQERFDDG